MRWAIAQKGCSQRRACGLVGLAPKTYRYRSRRPDDGELRRRLRQLAAERRRFGYKRLLILLRSEGVLELLIERIDVAPDGISVALHAAGIRSLVAELVDQEAPSLAAPGPFLEAAE